MITEKILKEGCIDDVEGKILLKYLKNKDMRSFIKKLGLLDDIFKFEFRGKVKENFSNYQQLIFSIQLIERFLKKRSDFKELEKYMLFKGFNIVDKLL